MNKLISGVYQWLRRCFPYRTRLIYWFRCQLSRIEYPFSSKKKASKKYLEELHNKYAGKRCFIVCNGPSLTAQDLERLHEANEFTFASNKIDKIFPQTKWRPTFYTIMDEGYQFSLIDVANRIPAEYKFFRTISFSRTRKVSGKCVFINTDGDRDLLNHPKFSEDIREVLYGIATVTFTMLQVARFMGFRDIYIIGCDNKYGKTMMKDGTVVDNGTASYFSGSAPQPAQVVATWEMDTAYECARKYADEHPDFNIYNATRGGYLEAFPRVDFDSLF